MTNTTVSPSDADDAPVALTDISWTLEPIARVEDVDALALAPAELLEYTAHLQEESRSLRRLAHEAIALVARQHDELRRAARVTEALRKEFLEFRERHRSAA